VNDHARPETDGHDEPALPAIVLTCDRYHLFTAHMIARYEALWPSHPFAFQVPYQRQPLRGPRITPHRTSEPIRGTVLELLRERPDEQWVYWCIDDKYPLRLVQPAVTRIADAVRATAAEDLDGILFCRARKMLWPDRLMPERRQGPAGTWLLRRKDYSQMWIHQFFRVKVLRHVFERFPESVPSAGALDSLKYTIPLPADHRLYVVETNLAEFGESTIEGRVTANCAASLKAHGFEVPAALADQAKPLTFGTIAGDAEGSS
jgi:hypothetical protein